MNYGHDLFRRAMAVQETLEEGARLVVRDWLLSYEGAAFVDAVTWLLEDDLGLVGSSDHLIGCQVIKNAVEELRADVKAGVYSGWGEAPESSQFVQALADRLATRVRRPS
jgi:hypothetical protein